MILEMEGGLKGIRIIIAIMEASIVAKPMAKEFTPGSMVKFTMANGTQVSNTATVSGKALMEIPILENGKNQRRRAMGFTRGKMGISMKVSGNSVSNMATVQICSEMVIYTQVSINKESQMAKVSIPGPAKMELFMQESSQRDSSMERADGKVGKVLNAISMMETTAMTRNMVLVYSLGLVETSIRENIKKMSVMAMVKCNGLMAVSTKENGREASSMESAR